MLEGIRRYQYSWQVQVPFALLALVMAFWGFGSSFFGSIRPIATVNGQKILGDQVDREANQLRSALQQMYGANAQAVLKSINIRQEAVERLGGHIRLYEEQPSEYRLQIRLPLEAR